MAKEPTFQELLYSHTIQESDDYGRQTRNAFAKIRLSPALAKELLKRSIPGQRPPKKNVVRRYADDMSADDWPFTGEPIICSSSHMMNGQHRCLAVIQSEKTIEVLVVFNIKPEAFYRMDQGTVRTASDFIPDMNGRVARAAAAALMWGEEAAPTNDPSANNWTMPRGDVVKVLERYPAIIDMPFHDMRSFLPPSIAIYCKVRTAYIAGWDHSWTDFWEGFASGQNLSGGDPRLALRNYLSSKTSKRGAKVSNSFKMQAVIRAWRAYQSAEKISRIVPSGWIWPGPKLVTFANPATEKLTAHGYNYTTEEE